MDRNMAKFHEILTKYMSKYALRKNEHIEVITWRTKVESMRHVHLYM